MACKCRICGTNDVDYMDDICELCAIGQDPYAAAMQTGSQKSPNVYTNNNIGGNTYGTAGNGRSRKILRSDK